MNRALKVFTQGMVFFAVAALTSSCGGGSDEPPTTRLYATFAVESETFHALITNPRGIEQAKALWAGTSKANIPVGGLVCTAQPWNQPWHWHFDPEEISFAESAIEICDGRPSDIDISCPGQGFCPWGARMTALRDCSADPNCP